MNAHGSGGYGWGDCPYCDSRLQHIDADHGDRHHPPHSAYLECVGCWRCYPEDGPTAEDEDAAWEQREAEEAEAAEAEADREFAEAMLQVFTAPMRAISESFHGKRK